MNKNDNDIILIEEGDMFYGTREQYTNAIATNCSNQDIIDFCKYHNLSLKINDEDVII